MAGIVAAARHGFEMENAVAYAEERYVGVNIFEDAHKAVAERLDHLPDSCAVSADALEAKRDIFEAKGVFSPGLIDGWVKMLRNYDDANLREQMAANPSLIKELVDRFINVG